MRRSVAVSVLELQPHQQVQGAQGGYRLEPLPSKVYEGSATLGSSNAAPPEPANPGGCEYDTRCKGNGVYEARQCVSPPPVITPATPAATEPAPPRTAPAPA